MARRHWRWRWRSCRHQARHPRNRARPVNRQSDHRRSPRHHLRPQPARSRHHLPRHPPHTTDRKLYPGVTTPPGLRPGHGWPDHRSFSRRGRQSYSAGPRALGSRLVQPDARTLSGGCPGTSSRVCIDSNPERCRNRLAFFPPGGILASAPRRRHDWLNVDPARDRHQPDVVAPQKLLLQGVLERSA